MFKYIGSDDIAATPRTSAEPRVALHSVMNAGGPAAMKSTEPDSKASFMTAGPPRSIQRTVSSVSPAARACFSMSPRSRMTSSGRKPTPPAPSGMRISVELPPDCPPQPAAKASTAATSARPAVR